MRIQASFARIEKKSEEFRELSERAVLQAKEFVKAHAQGSTTTVESPAITRIRPGRFTDSC
jgi:hypothetical protein